MAEIAPHGPITVEYTFYFTNGDYDAEVSFDAPIGTIATHDDVAILAAKAVEAMEDQHQGFRLMSREEFVSKQLSDKSGIRLGAFAVPGGSFSEVWAA